MAKYKCPICGQTVRVGVTLKVTPTCNSSKHTKAVKMEASK
jgi:endogenous inhibitor of DNA gyrase (YacG/DUF329 family)